MTSLPHTGLTPASRTTSRRAPGAASVAPSADLLPEAPHVHPGRRALWVLVWTLLGVMVMLLAGVAGLSAVVRGEERAAQDQAVVESELLAVSTAQANQSAATGRFTTSREALAAAGWVPADDVDVHLVSATQTTFCLAAGPTAGEPVLWATELGLTESPCD